MHWLLDLIYTESIAHTVVLLCLAILPGLWLGARSLGGVKIGLAGVLITGLAIGALGLPLDLDIVRFLREFGLILFVFGVGIQVGPGFFATFRDQGLKLVGLTCGIVGLGVGIAILEMKWFQLPVEAAVGILCGAVTNTPGLGSAQQALRDVLPQSSGAMATAGTGLAVTYPFGILGVILALILIRVTFKINLKDETARIDKERAQNSQEPHTFSVTVTNGDLVGKPATSLDVHAGLALAVSRLLRGDHVLVPRGGETLQLGDVLQIVCAKSDLKAVTAWVGEPAADLRLMPGDVAVRKVLVSREAGARLLSELRLPERFGTMVTRVLRSGVEFVPQGDIQLHLGDQLTVVGPKEDLHRVAKELGDSPSSLDHPNLLPVFVGIFLGILLGSVPLSLPGLPAPVRLGLAGGPMVVALLMGYRRRAGSMHFYISNGAIQFMREFGILLFLVAVGLESGASFLAAMLNGQGLAWMALGTAVTFVPVFVVGCVARWQGYNYLTITGLLAGATTNPPVLGYANGLAPTQAQSIAYASAYPFAMFLRVITAQVFVLFFAK
jgi:putative transport protein